MLAKEIDDCSVCPLYQKDCPGGWTGGAGGIPIEPPCCSWSDDTEVYKGMYEYDERDYSEQELKWERELEKELKKKHEQEEKERIKCKIKEVSEYGNVQIKPGRELMDKWLCPHCHNWFDEDYAWRDGDIYRATCPICYTHLAHSYLLD